MEIPDLETVTVDVQNGLATVRLDSPPVNAISAAMRSDLAAALEVIRDPDVRVALFTGTPKVFSVGADVSLFEEAESWTTREFRANSRILGRVFDGIEEVETPVLAAIEGTCVGGGYELALACDVRIAGPDATIGFPEHNIGLVPGLGGCSRFVGLVGPGRAKDLIFRKELVDGERALELGMVEHCVDDPVAFAESYAADLLDAPPQALGLAKRTVNAARDTDTRTAGLVESLAQSTLVKTDDHREGVEAFREKRDPEFSGH